MFPYGLPDHVTAPGLAPPSTGTHVPASQQAKRGQERLSSLVCSCCLPLTSLAPLAESRCSLTLSDSLTSHRCVRNRSSSRLQPTSLGLERHRRRLAVRAPPSHSHTPYPRIPPPACHAGPGGARVGRPPAGPMAFARWCVPASLSKVRYYY